MLRQRGRKGLWSAGNDEEGKDKQVWDKFLHGKFSSFCAALLGRISNAFLAGLLDLILV